MGDVEKAGESQPGGTGRSRVTVTPEEFTMVEFDAVEIAGIATELMDRLGFDGRLAVVVDEASPLARSTLVAGDPLTIEVEGGAFEDTKRPRRLSPDRTADVLGRLLLRHMDRGAGFSEAPAEDELSLAEHSAWEIYAVGRLERLGYRAQKKRRLYQFRNRHGFTDAADAAFERLWTGEGLTWADVVGISEEARAAIPSI